MSIWCLNQWKIGNRFGNLCRKLADTANADTANWPKAGGGPWHFKPDAHQSMVQLHYATANYLDLYDRIRPL